VRRTRPSRPAFPKGVTHANENPWSQSAPRKNPSARRVVPRPRGSLRTGYCHERAVWKLRWFLSDFNYDAELFAADELDDRRVIGLEGVIRLAYWGDDGHRHLDVQGFAPSERWHDLSLPLPPAETLAEAASA
jgi:hypothetical protein